MRPRRRYSIAGRKFESVLRVHHVEQIAELRAENAALKQRIQELESQLAMSPIGDSLMDWPLSKFHELEDNQ